jgi:hypothetical protein
VEEKKKTLLKNAGLVVGSAKKCHCLFLAG